MQARVGRRLQSGTCAFDEVRWNLSEFWRHSMNTSRRLLAALTLGTLSLVALVGCGSDETLSPGDECDPHYYYCPAGYVCAELVSGGYRCSGELVMSGAITNTSEGSGVKDAQVIALNDEGLAVGNV